MTVHKTICRLQSAPTRRDAGLVAAVALLADLVEKPDGFPASDLVPALHEVAQLAVAAAVNAEQTLRDQKARIAALERLAMTDPLTGLLNRRGMERALQVALATARRHDEQGVLVSIDLDGFKLVNDTYGHAVGDAVLKQVARLLDDSVRESDSVARVGGDEFVVLLTRVPWEDGLKRARSLETQLNRMAVNIDGRTIMVRASCGTQTYGGDDDGAALLDRADNAMYLRKRTRPEPAALAPADH